MHEIKIKHGKAVPVPDTPSSDSLIEDLSLDHRGKLTEKKCDILMCFALKLLDLNYRGKGLQVGCRVAVYP